MVFLTALPVAALLAAGIFNVTDYGARGDGVAKDTVAIQKAVEAAAAAGGGTVALSAGTYLSGTIWLRDNVDSPAGFRGTHASARVEGGDIPRLAK